MSSIQSHLLTLLTRCVNKELALHDDSATWTNYFLIVLISLLRARERVGEREQERKERESERETERERERERKRARD